MNKIVLCSECNSTGRVFSDANQRMVACNNCMGLGWVLEKWDKSSVVSTDFSGFSEEDYKTTTQPMGAPVL